jgi:carbamoylphosphate synthase large subunit
MKRDIVLFTGVQRFCRNLKERGYGIAVLREQGEAVIDRAEVDYLIDYDPRGLHALMEVVKQLPYRESILTVINRRERRVKEFAALNAALGRTGIGLEQAEWLTDKYLMRKRIAQHDPSLVPPFQLIEDPGMPPSQLRIGFPLMIKPRNLFKSILVTRCDGPAELGPALRSVAGRLAEAASRHGVEPERGVLAEEFLRGREFSIDSFVSPEGHIYHSPVVDLVVAEDIGVHDFHVFARKVPSQFASSQVAAIEEVAERGLRALGVANSPAHIDMIYTPTGPKVLEVGARVGGYRSEMMMLSFGVDLDEVAFSTSLGKGGDFVPRFEKGTAVLEFFPLREGILKGIEGLKEVRRLDSFHRLRQRTRAGEMVGLARQGYRCPLFVILNHNDQRAVNRDVEEARRTITIEVE